jgi:hypothetical protein
MISIPPLSGCDCEPVIVGETASGGNVSKDVIPANGSGLGGTVIAVNDGEVSGLCDTSVNCTSPAPCAFNVSVQVKLIVSSGIPVPTEFRIGPDTYPIAPVGGPVGDYTGSAPTKRYDLDCDTSKNVRVKVNGSTGTLLATATFTAICQECQG